MTIPAWREHAACAGTPEDWWFPRTWDGRYLDGVVPADAEARCEICPVHADCFDHALHHEPYGVFAGLSEHRRKQLRRENRIRLVSGPDPIAEERARAALAALAGLDEGDDDEEARPA